MEEPACITLRIMAIRIASKLFLQRPVPLMLLSLGEYMCWLNVFFLICVIVPNMLLPFF